VELAQEVLADLWGEEERVITREHIQRKVAEFFGIQALGHARQEPHQVGRLPAPRSHVPLAPAHPASLSDVGRAFGGRITRRSFHRVSKLQALIQEDPKLKQTIDTLTQGITL